MRCRVRRGPHGVGCHPLAPELVRGWCRARRGPRVPCPGRHRRRHVRWQNFVHRPLVIRRLPQGQRRRRRLRPGIGVRWGVVPLARVPAACTAIRLVGGVVTAIALVVLVGVVAVARW